MPRLLFLLLLGLPPCLGLIKNFEIKMNPLIEPSRVTSETIIENFGLASGGKVLITSEIPEQQDHVFFCLFTKSQWDTYQSLISSKAASKICLAPAAMRFQTNGFQDNLNFTATYADQYTLQLIYCKPKPFIINGTVQIYNMNLHGPSSGKEHLPLGQERAVQLYTVLLYCYAGLAVAWIADCRRLWAHVVAIHFGCSVTLFAKLLETMITLTQAVHKSGVGIEDTAISTAKNVLESISSILFLAVLLLISLGWTLIRDALTHREKRLVLGVFGFYVTIATLKFFCGSDNQACSAYLLTEYVIRSLIMLGIIVAMNFNIQQLRSSLHSDRWNNNTTPKLYDDLKKYQAFRWAFIGYLLLPTVLLIIKITILTWRFDWVNDMLNELLLLAIYVHVGVTFKPTPTSVFNQLADVVSLNGTESISRADLQLGQDRPRISDADRGIELTRRDVH